MDMTTIVVAASIPSAFTGFCFWLIEQNLKKRADSEKRNARSARNSWTNANRSERRMSSASSTA